MVHHMTSWSPALCGAHDSELLISLNFWRSKGRLLTEDQVERESLSALESGTVSVATATLFLIYSFSIGYGSHWFPLVKDGHNVLLETFQTFHSESTSSLPPFCLLQLDCSSIPPGCFLFTWSTFSSIHELKLSSKESTESESAAHGW